MSKQHQLLGAKLRGAGLGLRAQHIDVILNELPPIPWFEALTDNYLHFDSSPYRDLLRVREHYPICLHGVGLSLGSTDPLDYHYLAKLKKLIEVVQPDIVSEHCCWTSYNQQHSHDLLPLPYSEEAVNHVASRIQQVQDYLNIPIIIENVSTYLSFHQDEMAEWKFINEIVKKSDCFILLDVNNVYVSAANNHFDPIKYINNIDSARVKQYHLAGFEDKGDYLFDAHGCQVAEPVWNLFEHAVTKIGALPTLIEWDNNLPEFKILQEQAKQAQKILDREYE